MKLLKYIKLILPLILVTLCLYYFNSMSAKNDIIKKSEFVSQKLSSVSELTSTQYDYSNVVSVKNNLTFKDFNIPFTEKSFVVKYSGHITAGVDFTDASFQIIKNKLIITAPPSKILSHTIDEDNLCIFDERTSIFNKLTMDDMLEEIIADRDKTEAELLATGFLDKVNENTETLLKNIFSSCGFSEVEIIIS